MIQLLAISGSLRRVSSNTALLHAAARLAPPGLEIRLEPGIGTLPHFNPDLEGGEPAPVLAFRARLRSADGVLISSPEYAHGIPGSLKNALDWVVGSGELSGKPVALFNASPRASIAQASLAEVVRTMDARLSTAAAIVVPLLGRSLTAAAMAEDDAIASTIRRALAIFVAEISAGT